MKILNIDTLKFSIEINNYNSSMRDLLDKLSLKKAQSRNNVDPIEIEINDIYFEVNKKSAPFYSYSLKCNDFTICFAESVAPYNSPIIVVLHSQFLWSYGYKRAYNTFWDWFNKFNTHVLGTKMSRLDICVDTDEVAFVPSDMNSFITRAKFIDKHYEHNAFTGFSIGKGKPIMARIYNKTAEVKGSQKEWFYEIWKENGWNTKPVWRVEFQLRRKALVDLGINSVEDLWGKEDGLWCYLTSNWLQLKENSNKNVSRRKVRRKWQKIKSTNAAKTTSPLVRKHVKSGNIDILWRMIVGTILTLASRCGFGSLDETLEALKSKINIKLYQDQTTFPSEIEKRQKKNAS